MYSQPHRRRLSSIHCLFVLSLLLAVELGLGPASQTTAAEPLKVLLITGGCCHDYEYQSKQIIKSFELSDVPAEITVVNEGGKGTNAQIALYDNPEWAKGYDLVVHNECFADTKDSEYIERITSVHKAGMPSVVIHCAMHTYRSADTDSWREFLGVTSKHHEHQSNYPVEVVAPEHPIMQGFPKDWVTPKDELYIIEKVWPTATALAISKSESTGEASPCFWVNEYGKARVFGTTYGHGNATFDDEVFLKVIVRGALWTTHRLNSESSDQTESDK